jgi:hypothetical protein
MARLVSASLRNSVAYAQASFAPARAFSRSGRRQPTSQDVRLVSGYRPGNDAYYLGYVNERYDAQHGAGLMDIGVYLGDAVSYTLNWRLETYRDDQGNTTCALQARDTVRPPIPEGSVDAYWRHQAWYLCLIGNGVVLSPVGNGTGVPESAARWVMNTGIDSNGNPIRSFEPVSYRGAYLSPNLSADGKAPDLSQQLGINASLPPETCGGALQFYFEDVPATVPA